MLSAHIGHHHKHTHTHTHTHREREREREHLGDRGKGDGRQDPKTSTTTHHHSLWLWKCHFAASSLALPILRAPLVADAPHAYHSALPGYIDTTQKASPHSAHTPLPSSLVFSLCTSHLDSQPGPPALHHLPLCRHCLRGTAVPGWSSLVQPCLAPCPVRPCPSSSRLAPMLPVSIGLDTTRLTTVHSTTATDCLTVAHPVPSLHVCRTRGRPGSVRYPRTGGGPARSLLLWCLSSTMWSCGTVPCARAWVHGSSVPSSRL